MDESYFNVALSTSVVVFSFDGERLQTLIGKKPHDPFLGAPTLPTAWVRPEEAVEKVAAKVLLESLGEHDFYLEQLNAFAKLYRKPEGRVVNIAQFCLLNHDFLQQPPKDGFAWVPVVEVPQMVYDHNEIFDFARERLKRRVKRRPIGFRLLPREFTLGQIHSLYEQILEKRLDKRNFRKKLFSSQLLVELDKQVRVEGSKKPATLLCFDAKRYEKLTLKGYDFTF